MSLGYSHEQHQKDNKVLGQVALVPGGLFALEAAGFVGVKSGLIPETLVPPINWQEYAVGIGAPALALIVLFGLFANNIRKCERARGIRSR